MTFFLNNSLSLYQSPDYKPHVDGLRTIAVMSVVIYHIFEWLCPGGFIGVDIFFVISGYLITGGILKGLSKDTFTIKDFYKRRIRRIVPAYVAVVIFILVVSCIIYAPTILRIVSISAASSALFSANMAFTNMVDYYAPDAETNPILHLWSLGVEEHFYIVIPLLFLYANRKIQAHLGLLIWALIVLSLSLSIYCNFNTDTLSLFNFYMLPTRAWELLAGSVLAYYANHANRHELNLAPILSALGLIMCVIPCFLYNSNTIFPGYTALLPVIGAMLLIRYGHAGWVGVLLKSKLFVGIGLISYSLYLWHWPLVVFYRYFNPVNPSSFGLLAVLLISFLYAYFSWRFIEMPIRSCNNWNFKKATLIVSCSSIAILTFCGAVIISPDFRQGVSYVARVTGAYEENKEIATPIKPNRGEAMIHLGNPSTVDKPYTYILIGDSHARESVEGYKMFSEKTGINGLYHAKNIMLSDICYNSYLMHNISNVESVIDWVCKQEDIPFVVFSQRWTLRLTPGDDAYKSYNKDGKPHKDDALAFKEGFLNICKKLNSANKRIIIINEIPEQKFMVSDAKAIHDAFSIDYPHGVSYNSHNKTFKPINNFFNSLAGNTFITVLSARDCFFGNKEYCKILDDSGEIYYLDDDHLNSHGARFLLDYLTPQLKAIFSTLIDKN